MGGPRGTCRWPAAVLLAAAWPQRAVGATALRSRPAAWTARGSKEEEHRRPLSTRDVAFGVLSCSRYLETRLRAQLRTWLGGLENVLVSSEAEGGGSDLGVALLVDAALPGPQEQLPETGAPRALALVGALRERFPGARWYFFVDDDTYVYVPNLLRDVLGPRDPREPHYIGWASPVGPGLSGVLPGQWMPEIAIGGAGFAISRGLMAQLAPEVQRCRQAYSWNWQGDVRVAQCVADLGYGVEDDPHLYPEGVATELRYSGSRLLDGSGVPPASFHHLAPEELDRLHMAQVARGAGATGAGDADFGALALREATHHEPSLNLTFRLRFGWQVEVEGAARGRLVAGRLKAFEATPPGGFLQDYGGQPCGGEPAGAALEVLVEGRCRACGGGAALAVEGARALGPCGFVLRVCAACPWPTP